MSCNPAPHAVADLEPAYSDFIKRSKAKTLVINRVDGKFTQTIYAVGKTDAYLYVPIEVPENFPLIESLEYGCVTTKISRIGNYKEIAKRVGITHIVICPLEIGYIGAGYSDVPPIEALPQLEELSEITNEYI